MHQATATVPRMRVMHAVGAAVALIALISIAPTPAAAQSQRDTTSRSGAADKPGQTSRVNSTAEGASVTMQANGQTTTDTSAVMGSMDNIEIRFLPQSGMEGGGIRFMIQSSGKSDTSPPQIRTEESGTTTDSAKASPR